MASRDQDQSDRMIEQLIVWFLIGVGFLLVGLFFISTLMMKVILHVVNGQTGGALDREDGLAPLISGVVFAVVTLFWFPLLLQGGIAPPTAILWLILGGFAWGVAVGYKVLLDWWAESEKQFSAGYDVVEILGSPLDIRDARFDQNNGAIDVSTAVNDDLLEALILGSDR